MANPTFFSGSRRDTTSNFVGNKFSRAANAGLSCVLRYFSTSTKIGSTEGLVFSPDAKSGSRPKRRDFEFIVFSESLMRPETTRTREARRKTNPAINVRIRFRKERRANSGERKSVCTCTWSAAPRRRAIIQPVIPVSNGSCTETTSGFGNVNASHTASHTYKRRKKELVAYTCVCSLKHASRTLCLRREKIIISSSPNRFPYARMRAAEALLESKIVLSEPICRTFIPFRLQEEVLR